MSNVITQQYSTLPDYRDSINTYLSAVINKTGIVIGKEIFRGKIYDDNKVGSVLFECELNGKPVVLKLQMLQPVHEEVEIISALSQLKNNSHIRFPEILHHSAWNVNVKFGYTIFSKVVGEPIYSSNKATRYEQFDFVSFYKDYRSHFLEKPLFPPSDQEKQVSTFVQSRIHHWQSIAENYGPISEVDSELVVEFLTVSQYADQFTSMQFMHGHLTRHDIIKNPDNYYTVFSNLFWSYRPEYYDAVFHLWGSIKSSQDELGNVAEYIEGWIKAYETIPEIAQDRYFHKKIAFAIMERCIGALIVDLQVDVTVKDSVRKQFRTVYRFAAQRLQHN